MIVFGIGPRLCKAWIALQDATTTTPESTSLIRERNFVHPVFWETSFKCSSTRTVIASADSPLQLPNFLALLPFLETAGPSYYENGSASTNNRSNCCALPNSLLQAWQKRNSKPIGSHGTSLDTVLTSIQICSSTAKPPAMRSSACRCWVRWVGINFLATMSIDEILSMAKMLRNIVKVTKN